MPRIPTAALLAVAALAGALAGHSLFLELPSHFLAPHARATVALVNGEFGRSENAVARERMLDVSVVGPGAEVFHPEPSSWHDEGNTALLELETGPPGTYAIGVSTAPRVIELEAADFNRYLAHDGVLDTLAARRRDGELEEDVRERYSKHVKTILQVGAERSEAFAARLGYPIEIVPLQNPYELAPGDVLEVQVLVDGRALAGQRVYASYAGHHAHDEEGGHLEAVSTRTDARGIARIAIGTEGRWYVRLIHMEPVDEPDVDYESRWSTLTFEIRGRSSEGAALEASLFPFGALEVLALLAGLSAVLATRATRETRLG